MAIRIFPWGTVKDTPNGVVSFHLVGVRFDLTPREAGGVVKYIKSLRNYGTLIVAWTMSTSLGLKGSQIRLKWEPHPPTPKSILKIGHGGTSQSGWVTGATPAILDYDEAMELADALLAVKSSQTAKVAQTTP